MKKLLFILMSFIGLNASAQDVIVKRNGDELQCKILEVSKNEVKYKRWSNQEGPTFVEERNQIFMIKYQNGEKDVFEVKSMVNNSSSAVNIPNLIYDKKSISGLSSNGKMISLVEAQNIMGTDWSEFDKYNRQSKKGKHLLVTGIVFKSAATPLTVMAIAYGYPSLYAVASGLQTTSIPFLSTGIVNLVRGQRGCKRLVKQHDSSAVGFNSEFDFGIGVNSVNFRMTF